VGRVITKMFGNFWTNVVILVNFWSFNPLHVQVIIVFLTTYTSWAVEILFDIKENWFF
jgi:hypothetical protein